jgi:hypothetical protein
MIIDFHTHIFPSFFRNERTLFFPEEPAFKLIYNSPKSRLVGRKELLKNMDHDADTTTTLSNPFNITLID